MPSSFIFGTTYITLKGGKVKHILKMTHIIISDYFKTTVKKHSKMNDILLTQGKNYDIICKIGILYEEMER